MISLLDIIDNITDISVPTSIILFSLGLFFGSGDLMAASICILVISGLVMVIMIIIMLICLLVHWLRGE